MEFLQSSYFLIGAIAVAVLLVGLLILLRVRSRRISVTPRSLDTAVAKTTPYAQPAADPIRTAITTIVAGRGPLTATETRRLDLYRPDKLLDVVESMNTEIAEAGSGSSSQRERLNAIAEYVKSSAKQTTAPPEPEAPSLKPSQPVEPEPALEPEPEPEPKPAPGAEAPEPAGEVPTVAVEAPPEMVEVAPVTVEAPPVVMETPPILVETPVEIVELEPVPPATELNDTSTSAEEPALNAADLMTLPSEQWKDALQHAQFTELREILATSKDSDLKTKLVDHLEQDGSPEALMLLDKCLQDPDPEIRLYALNAAERILRDQE